MGNLGMSFVTVAALACGIALQPGCNEELPIDGAVVYRCQNSSQCGPGFECEDRGFAEGLVCVNQAVGLNDIGTDGADVAPDTVIDTVIDTAIDTAIDTPDDQGDLPPDEGPDLKDTADPDTADAPQDTDTPDGSETTDTADGETLDAGDVLDAGDIPDLCENVTCSGPFTCVAGFCVDADGMVPVAPGDFYIGCNQSLGINECIATTNQPQLKVTIALTYAIDQMEVTAAEYMACIAASACADPANLGAQGCSLEDNGSGSTQVKDGRDLFPINCITQAEAAALCTHQGKRLCSEAEWEKAARGGCEFQNSPCPSNMPRYAWGDDSPTCAEYAHFGYLPAGGNGCGTNTPAAVGSYPGGVSAYGLYDTAGNVGEIVEDCWHNSLTGAPQDGSAWNQDCTPSETRRGGGYLSDGPSIRSDVRTSAPVGSASPQFGVRCCRNVE